MADREHWPRIIDSGMSIVTINGHRSIEQGLNCRAHHDRIERDVAANLELAVTWNIPMLICFSGNREGLDDEAGAEITAEGLRRLAPLAEAAGVTLLLELLNHEFISTIDPVSGLQMAFDLLRSTEIGLKS